MESRGEGSVVKVVKVLQFFLIFSPSFPTFLVDQSGAAAAATEFSPRVVFTKQTQWQGILGPTNLRGYGFSPGEYHPGVEVSRAGGRTQTQAEASEESLIN